MRKILYFSDGAASQYKNRYNVANTARHEEDFGLDAEWHYFATSQGKNISDGLGGTLKREVARAGLVLPLEKQIQIPKQLFDWAKSNLTGLNLVYVAEEEVASTRKALHKRFNAATAVPGIRSFHAVVPEKNRVIFKLTSDSHDVAFSFELHNDPPMDTEEDAPTETR